MGPGCFFPTNPDLADILGRTDLDFENLYFLDFFGSQISGLGPLGPTWAHPLGPRVGPPTWAPRVGSFVAIASSLREPQLQEMQLDHFCRRLSSEL